MTDHKLYDRILATITEQLAEQGLPDANPMPLADAVWEVLGHGFSDEVPHFDGLDAAWAAAEAALPEGINGLYVERDRLKGEVRYFAGTWVAGRPLHGTDAGRGPTPAAALRALAAALATPDIEAKS